MLVHFNKESVGDIKRIRVIHKAFPSAVKCGIDAMTVKRDGYYNILIDNRKSEELQAHVLGKELTHIFLGNICGDEAIHVSGAWVYSDDGFEQEADREAEYFYNEFVSGRLGSYIVNEETFDGTLGEISEEKCDIKESVTSDKSGSNDGYDDNFVDAARLVVKEQKASVGLIQRNLEIGFNRSARILEQLC